jgi:hypothetical protein
LNTAQIGGGDSWLVERCCAKIDARLAIDRSDTKNGTGRIDSELERLSRSTSANTDWNRILLISKIKSKIKNGGVEQLCTYFFSLFSPVRSFSVVSQSYPTHCTVGYLNKTISFLDLRNLNG